MLHIYERGWSRNLKGHSVRSRNGSNLKHICLSTNEKRWQKKQEKMIEAQNGARSHALNHTSLSGNVIHNTNNPNFVTMVHINHFNYA